MLLSTPSALSSAAVCGLIQVHSLKNTSEFRCYCLARMNFVGDVVHFATATVLFNDDSATGDRSLRRGVAGDTGCGGSGVEPCGNYVTSLDMAGRSITLSLLDDDMLRCWDAPVQTAARRWGVSRTARSSIP